MSSRESANQTNHGKCQDGKKTNRWKGIRLPDRLTPEQEREFYRRISGGPVAITLSRPKVEPREGIARKGEHK